MIQNLFLKLIDDFNRRENTPASSTRKTLPFLRSLMLRALKNWRFGHLTIQFPEGNRTEFGDVHALERATIFVRENRVFHDLLFGGEIAVGDAYVEGLWSSDNLVTLLRLFVRNRPVLQFSTPFTRISEWSHRLGERMRSNTRQGAERNVHVHYDLGNDFYRLFLDQDSMAYSCAVYERDSDTLEVAQRQKIERICCKLQLHPSDHLVEIGSGWGGLAIHAAQSRACRVTTITASQEQLTLARERVAQAGVADLVEVIYCDYRDLKGQYDKLVSIEMFEQVGHRYFGDYFKTCERLLKREGIAVIQTIGMPEQDFDNYRSRVDWMQRRIFPGTFLPSLGSMVKAIGMHTDLVIRAVEDIGPHYAPTLREWRERFLRAQSQVLALGHSVEFIRAWELYLAFSEASFAERTLQDFQLTLNHAGAQTPN